MNPYANLQLFNPGQAFQQSFDAGRERRREANTRNALMQYMTAQMGGNGLVEGDNPMMDKALMDVARNNPQLGMQLMQQRQGQMAATREQQLKIVGQAAAMADTPEKWDQIAEQLELQGIKGASQYVGKFSPALRAALMAQAGVADKSQQPTSLERNYEFIKQHNPQLAESYIKNQAEGAPLIASNGDGTFTIIPRSMAGGMQPPPPPPGFVLDEGGQTASAPSGGFPIGPL